MRLLFIVINKLIKNENPRQVKDYRTTNRGSYTVDRFFQSDPRIKIEPVF